MDYLQGLDQLKARLRQVAPDRLNDVAVLEVRLLENLAEERRLGQHEALRAGRAQVLGELNRLAQDVLGVLFNELAASAEAQSPQPQSAAGHEGHAQQAQPTAYQHLQQLVEQGAPLDNLLRRLQPASSQRQITSREHDQICQRYATWYTTVVEALPEDLRRVFVEQYEGDPLVRPGLKHYLEHAGEPTPDDTPPAPERPSSGSSAWQYPYERYQDRLQQQLALLHQARARVMAEPTQVPAELRALIAEVFSGREHGYSAIDDLFVNGGCDKSWRVTPRSPTNSTKANYALGWIDGLALHAPEREAAIIARVAWTIILQGMTDSRSGYRMQQLLAQVGAAEPPAR